MTEARPSGTPASAGERKAENRSRASGLEVDVLREAGGWSAADEETVCRAAQHAYDVLRGKTPAELSIMLADDARIADLNRTYRGKDGPTNVLSFPAAEMPGVDTPLLGDVALAHETIVREAEAQRKRFADHLLHLTVHGVLHLLGHDHENDADAEDMEALERRILEDFGIADPYDADRGRREP